MIFPLQISVTLFQQNAAEGNRYSYIYPEGVAQGDIDRLLEDLVKDALSKEPELRDDMKMQLEFKMDPPDQALVSWIEQVRRERMGG